MLRGRVRNAGSTNGDEYHRNGDGEDGNKDPPTTPLPSRTSHAYTTPVNLSKQGDTLSGLLINEPKDSLESTAMRRLERGQKILLIDPIIETHMTLRLGLSREMRG
jgi:hypothetical protein